jgi:hypothetical protein
MAGTATVTAPSYNAGHNQSNGGANGALSIGSNRGRSYSPHARKILMEDEVLRSPDTAYVFVTGMPPMVLSPIKYYEDRLFGDLNDAALRPTPSIYSWVAAMAGLYFALPVALGLAGEHLPALPSREGRQASPPEAPDPVVRPLLDDIAETPRSPRHAATSRWPSEATCPGCQVTLPAPKAYAGQVLACPDCSTQFVIPRTR